MGISVAMAVYNGEKYIEEQILSILKQLKCNDELVISYDKSTDGTYRIISDLAVRDSRIKIFRGRRLVWSKILKMLCGIAKTTIYF